MNALLDALIRGAIKNRHLVLLGAVAVIVLGLLSARSAHLDALPGFTPPMVVVQAEAPGLGSSAVEELVTTPLEQALLGIPGVTKVRSTSSPGLAVLKMTFEEGTDVFRARQLVSEHIALAGERLPPELPSPRLAPITAPVGALLKLCYSVPAGDEEALPELRRFAEWQVRPRLEAIAGVSRVTVHGGAASRIEVRPEPSAMLAREVRLSDMERALETAQSLSPLGHATAGPQQEPVRANGLWEFGDLDVVASAVIASRNGLPVRIADVADVALGEAPAVGSALYDDEPAIYLQIDKLPWADTARVTERVEEALAGLDADLPPGARRRPPVFRQADFIHTSLAAVGRAMALGGLLVIVILVLLVRSPRLSVISLTALPLSVVGAATALLLLDLPINAMVLGGLAIAVGEVVDDAIVDVENVWRRLRENEGSASPRPALEVIHDASVEVRGAVVYASIIVVMVLLPIMLLGGVAGGIFSPLAEAYGLAMAASLVVALTVTPALCAILLPRAAKSTSTEPTITRWLRERYDGVLVRVRERPGRVLLPSAALGAASLAALPFLGGGFLPEFREGVLIAEVTAWPGTSLEETTRLARRVSRELRKGDEISHVAVRIGRASLDEDAAPVHRMEVDLALAPGAGDPEEVQARAMDRMRVIPGVRFGIEGFLGERVNELLSGERAPIAVKLFGADLSVLRDSARRFMASMERVPGIDAVRSVGLADVPTLDLEIDDARLAVAGIRRSDVVDSVAAWRQGLRVADVKVPGGFSLPVDIAGAGRFRERDDLAALPVFTSSSAVLPVSSFVDVVEGSEPPAIDHEGGRRVVTVTARAATAKLSDVAGRIEALAREELGSSVDWRIAGQAAEREEASTRLAVIVALVLTAVFASLWMAFGSAGDAAIVLAGLPLALVGGVVAAALLPEGVSMAGFVGFVALIGITSRNGVMIVAHKNELLSTNGGADVESLILQAGRERLLPILMTASTTFFGLLPLAASLGAAGSELEAPMAAIVCCGLVSSTALNLVAVPAFFLWREQRRESR